MPNPLAKHPPWRRLVIVSVVLPVMIMLAALAFAWPAARIAPRDLPVGIVGAQPASQQVVAGLTRSEPGAFAFSRYASLAQARSAIEDREVYGAFVVTSQRLTVQRITVLGASAASPAVAQLLTTVGQQLASHAAARAGQEPSAIQVRDIDVVASSASDPKGMVLASALLPVTICSIIMAAAVALLLEFRPAWRQLLALTIVSAAAGLGTYLIAQGFLGALPHEPVATWASLSLLLMAVSATTAGLIALIGAAGLGISAALMIFVGNAFSGVTSAPQLLPTAADRIGQWLPPGAGASLLRSTAYFHGHGAASHLGVLIGWSVLGLAAIFIGHHTPFRLAASPARKRPGPAGSGPAGASAVTAHA
jgi:ABC-2 family transporter protein